MQIEITTRLIALLTEATESPSVSSSLKQDAVVYLSEPSIPFYLVKELCLALRGKEGDGPWVNDVCKGSRIVLTPPPKRERSPDLVKRLELLKSREDERAYQAMVHGVAKRDHEDTSFNLLPSVRLQLSFAAHVLLTMFVFYLIGSYATRALSDKPAFQALGGALGLMFGLILETSLFMIRSIPLEKSRAD